MLYRAVVEDNNDPNKMGRVRVRIFGIHSPHNENSNEFEIVKKSNLPWAEVINTGFGLVSGVGLSTILRQGTWVWVILDDNDPNKPIVIGSITGKNSEDSSGKFSSGKGFYDPDEQYPISDRKSESDINRIVRGEKLSNTIHADINNNLDKVQGKTDPITGADVSQSEPNSLSDNAEYPDITVLETHSGHVIELDDTDGNERIRLYHTSGSYIEIRPDGTFVQKCANTDSESHYIHMSDVHEHVQKSVKLYIEENLDEIISGAVKRQLEDTLDEHIVGNVTRNMDANVEETTIGTTTLTYTDVLTETALSDKIVTTTGTLTDTTTGMATITYSDMLTETVVSEATLNYNSNVTMNISGNLTITAGGIVTINGSMINLN